MKRLHIARYALLVMVGLAMAGCQPGVDRAGEGDNSEHDGHAGAHGEEEAAGHQHGPHGGELFAFEPEQFRGEIKKSSGERVSIYLLANDSDKLHPVKADHLTLTLTEGREPQSFQLNAQSSSEEGLADHFSLADESLSTAVSAFRLKVELNVDGTTYTATLPRYTH